MNEQADVPRVCELEQIQALMGEVVRKSSKREDTCVYRGEPKRYPVASSGLYRKCRNSPNERFDIARVEHELIEHMSPRGHRPHVPHWA